MNRLWLCWVEYSHRCINIILELLPYDESWDQRQLLQSHATWGTHWLATGWKLQNSTNIPACTHVLFIDLWEYSTQDALQRSRN